MKSPAMELPNYFLADLPPEASLTAGMVREACLTLKRNQRQYLAPRSTKSVIRTLSGVAGNWLDPEYPFRRLLLEKGPAQTGFPQQTLIRSMDAFFEQLSAENLDALVVQDLGQAGRLDDMVSAPPERKAGQAAMAVGPHLLAHFTAGNVPNPALMSIVLGLLVSSAQFVKCARGTSFLPRLFAHSIYDAEPKMASCLEIAEWPGGTAPLESALFEEVDCVTATGSDETIGSIRSRLPPGVRFLGYAHRLSFGYVAQERLSRAAAKEIAARFAEDVIAWNQLGCLSPHLIYVEEGGATAPEQFAEMLSEELSAREEVEPRGPLPAAEAAMISSRRSFYQVRAAHSKDTCCWSSKDSTAWTVVYEAEPLFAPSCLNRFVYVKGVPALTEALKAAEAVRGKVSTVGLAAESGKAQEYAVELARWGVTRICAPGRMQRPPATWRHDGRPPLGDLVRWSSWEQE